MKHTGKMLAVLLVLVLALGAGAQAVAEGKDILVSRWAGPHADYQKQLIQGYEADKVTIDDVDYGNMKSKQILSFQSAPAPTTPCGWTANG